MEYICYKRFAQQALDGYVNLPRGTEVEEVEGLIACGEKAICKHTSQNAYDYFARNDDGHGLERGDLTTEIKKTLAKKDDKHQARWNKLWEDAAANKLRRQDHVDFWCWGFDFFNADIDQLKHIKELIQSV